MRTKLSQCAERATLLCALLLVVVGVCPAQGISGQLSAAVTQLEDRLPSLGLTDADQSQRAAELQAVKSALDAGYEYLALYRFQPVYVELKTQEYVVAKAAVKSGGVQAFEREWKRLGVELSHDRKLFKPAATSRLPAAIRALAESSFNQVATYHQSGRLYGLNTEIQYGLYYLGRAPASLSFALFCQTLSAAPSPQRLPTRSIEEDINRLEAEVLEAYRQADARARQDSFIRVNVTLKVATELNQAALYAGALQKYLEASMYFGVATLPASEVKELAALKAQGAELKQRLSGGEHSVGLLYWQIAQGALDRAAAGERKEESLKLATAIFDKGLPRYFHIYSGSKS